MKNNNIRGLILEINNNNYCEFSFSDSMDPEKCIICQDEFEQGQKLAGHEIAGHGNKETQTKVNKCAVHVFHKNCLQRWLKEKDCCPVDKQKINGLPTDMKPNNAQAAPNNAQAALSVRENHDAVYRNSLCSDIIQLIEDYKNEEDPDTKTQLETQIRTLGKRNVNVYVGLTMQVSIPMHKTLSDIHDYHELGDSLPYAGFDTQIRVSTEALNTLRAMIQPVNGLCSDIIQLIEDYKNEEDPNIKTQLETQIRDLGNQTLNNWPTFTPIHQAVSNIYYHARGEGGLPYEHFDTRIKVSEETLNTLRAVMQPPIEPQGEVMQLLVAGERNVRRRNVDNILPAQAANDQARGGGFLTRIIRCCLGR